MTKMKAALYGFGIAAILFHASGPAAAGDINQIQKQLKSDEISQDSRKNTIDETHNPFKNFDTATDEELEKFMDALGGDEYFYDPAANKKKSRNIYDDFFDELDKIAEKSGDDIDRLFDELEKIFDCDSNAAKKSSGSRISDDRPDDGRTSGGSVAAKNTDGSNISATTGNKAHNSSAVNAKPDAANSAAKPEAQTSNETGSSSVTANRRADAPTGSEFMKQVSGLTLKKYEEEVLRQIQNGNIPDFLKKMKEVQVTFKDSAGKEHTASYNVMPDYLAVGNNEDFCRVPMSPAIAQKIAQMYGCTLPTKKMVNDIYKQATVKLTPQPIDVSKGINKIPNFYEHQKMVEKQRAGKPLGELTAGNKKDVVVTNLLDQAMQKGKRQVAIYGWHMKNGKAIQPLSTIHESTYMDYSHGIRLVQNNMKIDGVTYKVSDVLKDPNLCKAISDEGVIKNSAAVR